MIGNPLENPPARVDFRCPRLLAHICPARALFAPARASGSRRSRRSRLPASCMPPARARPASPLGGRSSMVNRNGDPSHRFLGKGNVHESFSRAHIPSHFPHNGISHSVCQSHMGASVRTCCTYMHVRPEMCGCANRRSAHSSARHTFTHARSLSAHPHAQPACATVPTLHKGRPPTIPVRALMRCDK